MSDKLCSEVSSVLEWKLGGLEFDPGIQTALISRWSLKTSVVDTRMRANKLENKFNKL